MDFFVVKPEDRHVALRSAPGPLLLLLLWPHYSSYRVAHRGRPQGPEKIYFSKGNLLGAFLAFRVDTYVALVHYQSIRSRFHSTGRPKSTSGIYFLVVELQGLVGVLQYFLLRTAVALSFPLCTVREASRECRHVPTVVPDVFASGVVDGRLSTVWLSIGGLVKKFYCEGRARVAYQALEVLHREHLIGNFPHGFPHNWRDDRAPPPAPPRPQRRATCDVGPPLRTCMTCLLNDP